MPSKFDQIHYQRTKYIIDTDLSMGQVDCVSQWKPRFFMPVLMSQIMICCWSSWVERMGLNVTMYRSQGEKSIS